MPQIIILVKQVLNNRIFRNLSKSILYFGASILGLLIALFSSPIFARNMSSSDFAITGYFNSVNSILFPMYTLLFYSFYIMRYFKQNESENMKTLGSLIIFLFFWNLIFFGVAYILLFNYFKFSSVELPFFPFALITLSTSVFAIYRTFLSINYRIRKMAWKFFLLMSFAKVLNVLFSLILVVKFNMGAQGKLMGVLIGEIIIAVFSVIELRKYMVFKIDFKIIKSAIKFSLPLLISGFPHLIIVNYDRILLEKLNNVDEFALYNIGANISGYLLIMGTALFQAFEPDIYKFVNNNQKKKLIYSIIIVVSIVLFVSIIFILFSENIISILTANRYTMAYQYANILALYAVFHVTYSFLAGVIIALNKPKIALYITMFVGLSGIIIYKIFINEWQFYGAAYSKLLLMGMLVVISLLYIIFLYAKRVNAENR